MNYNLTDYNSSALRIIHNMTQDKIKELDAHVSKAKEYIPEGEVLNDITRKDRREMSILREFDVHVLTSLQIVKDRETTHAN